MDVREVTESFLLIIIIFMIWSTIQQFLHVNNEYNECVRTALEAQLIAENAVQTSDMCIQWVDDTQQALVGMRGIQQ